MNRNQRTSLPLIFCNFWLLLYVILWKRRVTLIHSFWVSVHFPYHFNWFYLPRICWRIHTEISQMAIDHPAWTSSCHKPLDRWFMTLIGEMASPPSETTQFPCLGLRSPLSTLTLNGNKNICICVHLLWKISRICNGKLLYCKWYAVEATWL